MKRPKQAPNRALGRYAYFTGVGFQMLAIIGLFTYIGHRIDQSGNGDRPLWTALFAVTGVCISIYTVIKAVLRKR